jgi:hypothetical protein
MVRIMIWSDERLRIAADGQDLDVPAGEAVAGIHRLDPARGDENQRQALQHLLIIGHIAVGDEPGHRLHAVTLRVQHEIRCMAPIADAEDDVGPEPAIVPLLFLRRLEVGRPDLDPHLPQTPVQKAPLRRQT